MTAYMTALSQAQLDMYIIAGKPRPLLAETCDGILTKGVGVGAGWRLEG